MRNPTLPGAGGSANGTNPGGNGGGVILLSTSNLVLNGEIRANGAGTPSAAAGAGGSINLTVTNQLSGSGSVRATGATGGHFNNRWTHGGGGRIAVRYGTLSNFSLSQLVAHGGSYGGASGPGTVFARSSTQTHGDLRIDNNGSWPSSPPTLLSADTFDSFVISRAATVTVSGDLTVTSPTFAVTDASVAFNGSVHTPALTSLSLSGGTSFSQPWSFPAGIALSLTSGVHTFNTPSPISLSSLSLSGNSTLTSTSSSLSLLVSGDTNVGTGSTINLAGKGFPGGLTPSNPDSRGGSFNGFTEVGAGGSHGGHGSFATRGVTYGDFRAPSIPGAGGSASGTTPGGHGGGALTLTTSTLTLNGTIDVNGAYGTGPSGSGAGGSAFLSVAGQLSGTGSVSARGGYSTLAGGGGRIALIYDTNTTFNVGNLNAAPRSDSAGAGTIFLKSGTQPLGELRIDRGMSFKGTGQPTLIPYENSGVLELDVFRARNGARVSTPNQIPAPIYEVDASSEVVP